MNEHKRGFRGGVTLKILFIGLLGLILLVPAAMIQELVTERAGRLESARAEIAGRWGEMQIVGAPMLELPFRYSETHDGESVRISDVLVVLPQSLSISGNMEPTTLRRGIYEVPVYTAALDVEGVLPAPPIADLQKRFPDIEFLWSEAMLVLPLADARPLAEPVRLRLADAEAELQAGGATGCFGMAAPAPMIWQPLSTGAVPVTLPPGARIVAGPSPTPSLGRAAAASCPSWDRLVVSYAALGLEPLNAPQSFSLKVALRGTSGLRFLPFGDVTDVRLESTWPSPSFVGAFVPAERSVAEQGFTATWRTLAFGRGYPSSGLRSAGFESLLASSTFGVDLVAPLGVHEASVRAGKYAVLFVALTFLVYFLFEVFGGLRLHALHYLCVGFANCLFFLLLLAIGEHLGFGKAYVLSALASTSLIAGYSAAILGTGRRALSVAGLLGLVYAYLYVTLRAEDYALLIGALGLFVVLAVFMGVTRRVDWYALSFERHFSQPL